jgi:RNA polymerase sigma-70 factor (ECF subfamily)
VSAANVRAHLTKTAASSVLGSGVLRDRKGKGDRALLREVAEGRREALASLYDQHAASLFRHALALTRRRTDAEDLVHGVFVKLAGLGGDLLGLREPATYLHRMVHTTWIDAHRRSRLAERYAHDTVPAVAAPGHDEAIGVMRALDELPAEQREVVVLHVMEGFSFREIRSLTGVSLFTAAARYRLAVGKLRVSLGPARAVTP